MQSTLQMADMIVIVGYFALMLGIGAYFYRRMRDMSDYFSGGKRIPWWLSGVSFFMSSFSVAAFVQYSAIAYEHGCVAVTLIWVTIPATLAGVMCFSLRWRRSRIDSPVEYLETRYSGAVRQLFAWHGIPVRIIDDALKLVAISLFISPILGWSMWHSMLGAGVIMLIYTLMGGLWAVVVTDFTQFIIMAAAIGVLVPLSLARVDGVSGFIQNAPDGFFHTMAAPYNWVWLVTTVVLFSLLYSSVQWSLIQRYYCVPREKDAYRVGWLVVVLNIIVPPLMFLPAMAARIHMPVLPEGMEVYPAVCQTLLPTGMLGLVMAAMFAATMSMLSSDYNVCASVLTNDVYRRLYRPHATAGELVLAGRLFTLLVGSLSIGVAMLMINLGGEDLFKAMVSLFSLAGPPVALPMLAGLMSRRVTSAGAMCGCLLGIAAGLCVYFLAPDEWALRNGTIIAKQAMLIIVTVLVTGVVMTGVSMADVRLPGERERVDAFLNRLKQPVGTLEEDRAAGSRRGAFSPFGVVGVSLLMVGILLAGSIRWTDDPLARKMNLWIGSVLAVVGWLMAMGAWLGKPKQEDTP